MKTIRITAIVLAVFASITACKKDEKETLDFDYQSAVDNSLAEGIYSDVNNISNQAVENGNTGLATYRTGEGNGLLSVCNGNRHSRQCRQRRQPGGGFRKYQLSLP